MQSLWYHLIGWFLTFVRNCWKSDNLSPSLMIVYEACLESKDTQVLNMYSIFSLQKRHCEWIVCT